MAVDLKMALRSPRDMLGGYVILPRLIDKVRLNARGLLPHDYMKNLLISSAMTLDGQLLEFTGLDGVELKRVILSAGTDEAILDWVEHHARPHTQAEKQEWAKSIETARAGPARVAYRQQLYPDLAQRVDVGALNPFDLIDMDEGRVSIQDFAG